MKSAPNAVTPDSSGKFVSFDEAILQSPDWWTKLRTKETESTTRSMKESDELGESLRDGVKDLDQLYVVPYSGAYYAILNVHDLRERPDSARIALWFEVRGACAFGTAKINDSPYVDTVIGPFDDLYSANVFREEWIALDNRSFKTARNNAVRLANVFCVNVYMRDARDATGSPVTTNDSLVKPVLSPTVVPEIKEKSPQPYQMAPIKMNLLPIQWPATWSGRYEAFMTDERKEFTQRHHTHRYYEPGTTTPKINFLLSCAGMGDKRDHDIARLKERLGDADRTLQTEKNRVNNLLLAKEEARRSYESQLAERDKKIVELEQELKRQESTNYYQAGWFQALAARRWREITQLEFKVEKMSLVHTENEKNKERVSELEALCDAQMSELVTLRECDDAHERALQQLQERYALLEEYVTGMNAIVERFKTLMSSDGSS
jgi:hypothetical protein